MVRFSRMTALFLAAAMTAAPAFAVRTHRGAATGHAVRVHKSSGKSTRTHGKAAKASHKIHGQQVIAPERVMEIQEALIREHYLNGEANGQWDSDTQAAMQKFQGDNGWQTRLMPDSRALKKLGLGPDYSKAINADASLAAPAAAVPSPAATGIPSDQTTGFAAAAGVSQ